MIPRHQAEQLLEVAARPFLKRLRTDHEQATVKLQPVFHHIENNAFDPDLNVDRIKLACGIRDHSMASQFREITGLSPSEYLREGRMATAARLLRETALPVGQIAQLTGYPSLPGFSRAFTKWAQQRPSTYRRGGWSQEEAIGCSVAKYSEIAMWRRAWEGHLSQHELDELIYQLRLSQQSPAAPAALVPSSPEVTPDLEAAERSRAQEVWEAVAQATPDEQLELVRFGVRFRTPALFRLLCEKSAPEGRADRRRGVQLAELALDSLRATELLTGTDQQLLTAEGWVCVANARRLAMDLSGSEEAFAQAGILVAAGAAPAPFLARYFARKAALRWWQKRLDEALDLNARAVALFRQLGEPVETAKTLISRAEIQIYQDLPQAAIQLLEEAVFELPDNAEPYLQFSAHFNRAYLLMEIGNYTEASKVLEQVIRFQNAAASPAGLSHTRWLEGLVGLHAEDLEIAEQRILEARFGFMQTAQWGYAALASLDLARVYLEQNREGDVWLLVSEVVPVLEDLQLQGQREVAKCITLLRTAIERRSLSLEALRQVGSFLEGVRRDPTLQRRV